MDDSSAGESSPGPEARRRSGRVTKKPDNLVNDGTNSTKRKRVASGAVDGADVDGDVDMIEDGEQLSEDELSEEDSGSEPDDPDDDDVKPARKRARKATRDAETTKTASKPRAKKPKHNDDGLSLAIRPASKSARPAKARPKKAARFSTAQEVGGLYGMYESCILIGQF